MRMLMAREVDYGIEKWMTIIYAWGSAHEKFDVCIEVAQ